MKKKLKKTLTVAVAAALLCTQYRLSFAAAEVTTKPLVYSNYSFDGGSYNNTGSDSLSAKAGNQIGTFNSALLANEWITDHTDSTTNGLAKGFSSTNAVEVPNDAITFNTFTASAWFACAHIDGRSNAGTVQRIMGNGGYGENAGWYVGVLVKNNGDTFLGVNIGGASGKTEFIDVTASKGIYLGNSWHNVILVADRANNKASVYLDGAELVSFDTTDSWYNDAATNAYIGGYKAGDNVVEGFCGFLSDVQSINRAMSATQVEAYCGAGSTNSKTLLAAQFGNEITKIEVTTKPTKTSYTKGEAFDKTGMVVTATHMDGTTSSVTNYTVPETVPDNGVVTVSYQGYTCTVNVTVDGKQEIDTTKFQFDKNGGVHYTFDNQKDEYGVTTVGNIQYTAGRTGQAGDYAISLDGNSYLKMDAANLSFDKDFTVAFWAKMPNNGTKYDSVQRVFSTGVWGGGESGFMVGFYNCRQGESWSKVVTGIGTPSPSLNWSDAMELLDNGMWHQVTASFSGTTKKITLYFDGEVAGTYSYPADGSTVTGYEYTAIGGHLDANGVFSEGFKGLIDDVFVINRALSGSEVKALVRTNMLSDSPTTYDDSPIMESTFIFFAVAALFVGCYAGIKRRQKSY